jgi:hypothetical protein
MCGGIREVVCVLLQRWFLDMVGAFDSTGDEY